MQVTVGINRAYLILAAAEGGARVYIQFHGDELSAMFHFQEDEADVVLVHGRMRLVANLYFQGVVVHPRNCR